MTELTDSGLLFDYHATPDEVYITRDPLNPSIVTITVAVRNNTSEDVISDGIQFTIEHGNGPGDLTNNVATIIAASLDELRWSIVEFAKGVYNADPVPPYTGLKAGEAVTFLFTQVEVNATTGPATIRVYEDFPDESRNGQLTFNKVKSNLNIDIFSANPAIIDKGEQSELSWVTTAASRVALLPGDPQGLKTTDSYEVEPPATTNYYLSAYGIGPRLTSVFPVTVRDDKVEIISLFSTKSEVAIGEKVTIYWEMQNVNSGILGINDKKETVGRIGNKEVAIDADTTISLKAEKDGQEAFEEISVILHRVRITSYGVSGSCNKGGTQYLKWSTEYATDVRLETDYSILGNKNDLPASGEFSLRDYYRPDPFYFKLITKGYESEEQKTLYTSWCWDNCM